jgi:cell division protein FtsN
VRKIYSKSGTPGYYIQVGYFQENRPSEEFINRVKFSGLSYQLVKKYNGEKLGEYALIGPYISYNKAKEILATAREFVTSNAFIVKVVRP